MEWWWVKLDFYENLDKMHVKLFPNFTSFSFDNLGFIIVSRNPRTETFREY